MNRRLLLVGGLALVVVLLIWNIAFFAPAGKDVEKAETRNAAAVQQQAVLKRRLAVLQANPPNQTQTQAELDKLEAAIPPEPGLASFIRSAYEIKAQAGVDWVSIQPAPPTTGAGVSDIKMQIVVRGGFFQVLDYLTRLQALERIVVVDAIDVQTSDGSSSSGGSATTPTTTTDTGGAPDLNVTLNARMFTQAQVVATGTATPSTVATTPTSRGATATIPTNPGASN